MFSGYINVDAKKDNNIFYWFTESDLPNTSDVPLIMWMNGGPGASSIIGILAENIGLYSIKDGGKVA